MSTRRERGYPLIELMVVVLIGILIAIALPTFVGARTRDMATRSELRTALAAGLIHVAETRNWTGSTVADAEVAEPVLDRVDVTDPAVGEISIVQGAGRDLLLVPVPGA